MLALVIQRQINIKYNSYLKLAVSMAIVSRCVLAGLVEGGRKEKESTNPRVSQYVPSVLPFSSSSTIKFWVRVKRFFLSLIWVSATVWVIWQQSVLTPLVPRFWLLSWLTNKVQKHPKVVFWGRACGIYYTCMTVPITRHVGMLCVRVSVRNMGCPSTVCPAVSTHWHTGEW